MLIANGKKSICFTKVLDTYEEIDDGTSLVEDRTYNREDWAKKAKWTLDAADALLNVTKSTFGEPVLNYLKYYVAITVGGSNYMWLHRRINKSLLTLRMAQFLQDEATGLLDAQNITYVRKTKTIKIAVDREMIERNADLFASIAALVKKSWEGG